MPRRAPGPLPGRRATGAGDRRRSRRRGGRWCATLALAISVLVGRQPVLTQVPPRWRRSTSATVCPAPASRAASDGPAWPPPMTMASKRSLMPRHRGDEAEEDRRGILEQGRRAVGAEGGGQPCHAAGAAEVPSDRADPPAIRPGTEAPAAAPRAAPQRPPETRRAPNCAGPCGSAWSAAGRRRTRRARRREERARPSRSDERRPRSARGRSSRATPPRRRPPAHHRPRSGDEADQEQHEKGHPIPSPSRHARRRSRGARAQPGAPERNRHGAPQEVSEPLRGDRGLGEPQGLPLGRGA